LEVEKIEMVCIAVNELDEAVQFYGRLLDTRFEIRETPIKEGVVRWGIAPFGLELLERPVKGPESDTVRSFHLRVPDVERAREEMKSKGFNPFEQFTAGQLRELVYHIRGLRIIFVDHKGEARQD
jgi:predicted enzyme related to lactoylglutathione lyase